MLRLEPLATYTLAQLGGGDDMLDGPFVVSTSPSPVRFGLLVSLQGAQGGAMPSPQTVHWSRDVPPPMKRDPVEVFLRRGGNALYLGTAKLSRRGKPGEKYKVAFALDTPMPEDEWRASVAAASAPPPPAPEVGLVALTAGSSTQQRLAALKTFVDRWYGAPATAPVLDAAAASSSLVGDGPAVLRAFHALVAGRTVCVQNALASTRDGDRIVFYVENQHVCEWATDVSGEDPPVFVRARERGAPWQRETERLSTFLAGVLIAEACFAAPFSARNDALDRAGLARLGKRVRPLLLGGWATSGWQFFASGGVVAFTVPNGSDVGAWLGSIDRRYLEPLESLVAEWPEVGF